MLENKTIQGYKYIKVDNVNIAYLSAVIPSNGMGTLSVNVQVMSKDMLENNKEYFLEEYNKFKQDVEEEAFVNCGWNVFETEEDKVVEEQPQPEDKEDNIEIEPPIDEGAKEEIPSEEPKDEIVEEGDLDEDMFVDMEGVEYPSEDLDIEMGVIPEENIDNEIMVGEEGVEYPSDDLDIEMGVIPEENIDEDMFVKEDGVEYPEDNLDEGMFVVPEESIYENIE